MERSQKTVVVDSFKESVSAAQAVVLTEFHGLTVAEAGSLRAMLRENGVQFKVIKNTLAKRAIEGTDLAVLSDSLTGPTAWAYSADDPVGPARVLMDFLKGPVKDHLHIKVGYLGGKELSAADVENLAALPSKDQLRAQLLSLFTANATKFVRVLAARPSEFLSLLNNRRDDLENN